MPTISPEDPFICDFLVIRKDGGHHFQRYVYPLNKEEKEKIMKTSIYSAKQIKDGLNDMLHVDWIVTSNSVYPFDVFARLSPELRMNYYSILAHVCGKDLPASYPGSETAEDRTNYVVLLACFLLTMPDEDLIDLVTEWLNLEGDHDSL